MYPPADPWASDEKPADAPPPIYGRAPVPTPAPAREPTAEYPQVELPTRTAPPPVPAVSWHRPSRASLRRLADGWGFSATGLLVAFCGWGVWAAAQRGTGTPSLIGFAFTLTVAVGVFTLARLFGYLVVEQVMGRVRLHARWSHLIAGLFLAVAGVGYFVNTSWLVTVSDWIRDGWEWVRDVWPW